MLIPEKWELISHGRNCRDNLSNETIRHVRKTRTPLAATQSPVQEVRGRVAQGISTARFNLSPLGILVFWISLRTACAMWHFLALYVSFFSFHVASRVPLVVYEEILMFAP